MYLGAYTFPKTVGMLGVEAIVVLVGCGIILSYYGNRLFPCAFCWLQEKHLHLLLQQMKILEPGPAGPNTNESLLHGFLIPTPYVYALVLYFLFMLFGAGVVFFDVFLNLDVAFSCESAATGSECFLNITDIAAKQLTFTFDNFADQPIDCDNDSLTALLDNTTLSCCKYNLDIGKAAGIAGGMITISMLIIKAITGCFLFLKRQEPTVDHKSCKHCCRAMLICLTLTCQALILIMFIVMLSVSKLRNLLVQPSILFQFFNFFGAIFIAVTVPCFDFTSDEDMEGTPLINASSKKI